MAQAISDFRAEKRWTQSELAHQLGITRSALAAYESGRVNPNTQVVRRLIDLGLDLDVENPADKVGIIGRLIEYSAPKKARMRFAGVVPCSSEWGDPLESTEYIEVSPQFGHPDRYAAKVVGVSCWPALQPGDITIWHRDLSPPFGVIVLAQRKPDHCCTVKRLVYDEKGARPRLEPINPASSEPEDGEGWGVIARLVGVERGSEAPSRTWFWEPGLRPEHLS